MKRSDLCQVLWVGKNPLISTETAGRDHPALLLYLITTLWSPAGEEADNSPAGTAYLGEQFNCKERGILLPED